MAIVLPNIGEQLKNSLPGIRNLLASIANPNFQQQAALRQAMLEGRVQPEDLTDPEVTERRFGKGTGGFAEPTARSEVGRLSREEIERIRTLPAGSPEREELIARAVGIQTSTERKRGEQGVKIGEQTIQRNQQEISKAEEEETRKRQNRIVASRAVMMLGGKENLYKAYKEGKLDAPTLAAIQADEEFGEVFKMQRDDYWRQQQVDLANQRLDAKSAAKELNLRIAQEIVERAQAANIQTKVEDVLLILNDRTLEKKYAGMSAPPPGEENLWAAAHATINNRKMLSDDRKKTAREYFRRQTSGIVAALNDKKVKERGDTGIQSLVDQYNSLARELLGGYLNDNEIPQIAYDKEGRGKNQTAMGIDWLNPDDKTVRYTQGFDADLMTADPAPQVTKVDPIDRIAQDIIEGRASLEEQMRLAPDTASANRLKVKVEQLRIKGK